MKLSLFLLLFFTLQMNASVWSQTMSVKVKNSTLQELFLQIEKSSNYRFFYNNDEVDVNQHVSVDAEKKTVADILTSAFKGLPYSFRERDNKVILIERTSATSNVLNSSVQQQKSVSGKVTDSSGSPLPGVSVVVKGTTNGTITDGNGNYSLPNVPENATIQFSFVGMKGQEVAVGNQSTINVVMEEDAIGIEEVVAIGYGTQSKSKISGAIAKIDSKGFQDLPTSNPADAIMGLASGVQVQSGAGGTPGASPIIRVRGMSSLGSNNEPLYVVDGYPLPNSSQFARINSSDIESIEILKDAASAAIYGSRASNGVVIVTTKRGDAGKTRFEFSASTGIQQITKKVDVMNRDEFVKFSIDAATVRKSKYPDIFNTPESLPDTDWQDVIFRTAPISEYNLVASGGTEKIRYSVSAGYLTQTGTLVGTDYKQGTLRANLDANLTSKLKLGINFAPSYSDQNRRVAGGTYNSSNDGIPNPVYTAIIHYPIIPVRYENGNYGQVNGDPATSQYNYLQFNIFNPLSVLELTEDNEKSYRIQNNMYLEYEFLRGLKLKTQLGMTFDQGLANFYLPATLATQAETTASLTNPILNNIRARVTNSRAIDYLWENTATYTKSIGNHTFNGLLLYSQQKFTSTASTITGVNGTFTNDLIHNPTAAATINGVLGYGLNSFVSYAGRINYDYKAKYILSAALRRDGSSRFGTANRFGYFPSVSSSWRISEENFFKKIKPVVNELKLRASYGKTGNAGIGDFRWQNNIIQSNYSFGNVRQSGTGEDGFLSTNLTWEKNNQVDFGAEIGFLKDRINLTLDLYKKTTDGMLFNRGLPAIVGYATSFTTNIGYMWNKGLELELSTKNLVGEFKWQTDFNISFNRNKVTFLDGRQELDYQSAANWANVYRIKVGDPIGNIYGLKMLGVYKDQADLDASPKWIGGSQIGDYKALDSDKSGVVSNDDYVVLGNGLPDFTYGITNRFSFKSFDASVVLQGTYGNSIVNGATRHSNVARGFFNGIDDLIDNYYLPSKGNGDAKYARPNYAGLATATQFTSYAVEDGSFLRIRTVTIGYNLPTSIARKLKLNSLRVYLSGMNLYTFTKYPGYNPEPSINGNSAYTPGVDLGTYPSNRTMSVGLNIGF